MLLAAYLGHRRCGKLSAQVREPKHVTDPLLYTHFDCVAEGALQGRVTCILCSSRRDSWPVCCTCHGSHNALHIQALCVRGTCIVV